MTHKVRKTNKYNNTESHEIPDFIDLATFSDAFASPLVQLGLKLETLHLFNNALAIDKNSYAPVLIYRDFMGKIQGQVTHANLFWNLKKNPDSNGFFFSELPLSASLIKRVHIFPSALDLMAYRQLFGDSDIHTFMVAPHPYQDVISLLRVEQFFRGAHIISQFSRFSFGGILANIRIALALLRLPYEISVNDHFEYIIKIDQHSFPINKAGLNAIILKFNKKKKPLTIKGPKVEHPNYLNILNPDE